MEVGTGDVGDVRLISAEIEIQSSNVLYSVGPLVIGSGVCVPGRWSRPIFFSVSPSLLPSPSYAPPSRTHIILRTYPHDIGTPTSSRNSWTGFAQC